MPESLPAEKRTAFKIKDANPFGALKLLNSTPLLLKRLSMINTLYLLAHHVLPVTFAAYGLSLRLGCEDGGHHIGNGRCRQHHRAGRAGWPDRQSDRRAAGASRSLVSGVAALSIYGLAPAGYLVLGRNTPLARLWDCLDRRTGADDARVSAEASGANWGANSSLMGLPVWSARCCSVVLSAGKAYGRACRLPARRSVLAAIGPARWLRVIDRGTA